VIDHVSVTRMLAVLVLFGALLAADRLNAQTPAPPPPAASPPSTLLPRPSPATKPQTPAVKPAAGTATTPAPTRGGHEPDIAYGAYQRGYFLTAFAEATRRVETKDDMRAMTLLGELYSNGLGVPLDDAKAAKWYRLAADRGDRDAMFALAIFNISHRGGLHDRAEAARLFASAAKLGHAAAAYDLGLLYLEGQQFPQDYARAAELFRAASDQGNSEAQYALATLYKEGKGVEKDPVEAARLLAAAAIAENPTPKWNTPSRCSTAPAFLRTNPRRPRCFARRLCAEVRSPRTASPDFLASATVPPSIRSRQSNGT